MVFRKIQNKEEIKAEKVALFDSGRCVSPLDNWADFNIFLDFFIINIASSLKNTVNNIFRQHKGI